MILNKARKYAFGAFRALFFAFQCAQEQLLALIGILIAFSLLTVAVNIGLYTAELQAFRSSFIADLDLARNQFINESTYLYMQGCKDGTNWTDKPTVSPNGFNTNSSSYYCTQQLEYRIDYINERAFRLGKPNRY